MKHLSSNKTHSSRSPIPTNILKTLGFNTETFSFSSSVYANTFLQTSSKDMELKIGNYTPKRRKNTSMKNTLSESSSPANTETELNDLTGTQLSLIGNHETVQSVIHLILDILSTRPPLSTLSGDMEKRKWAQSILIALVTWLATRPKN